MTLNRIVCATCACVMLFAADAAPAQSAASDPASAAVTIPSAIPIFPLPNVVLFPGLSRPLLIYEPRYRAMVADALKGDRIIGMVLLKPGFEADYDGRPPIYEIGCAGQIADYQELPDGRYMILLRGLVKFRVTSEDQTRPYRVARVDAMPEVTKDTELAPLSTSRERLASLLVAIVPLGSDLPPVELPDGTYVNTVASYLDIPEATRQGLLERSGLLSRAQALVNLLETR
jgi:Lon protease-like protein